jgi:hypothetical protein
MIPPRTQRARETLLASVAVNGIQVRLVLIEDNGKVYLFDGSGRLDAAEAAGAKIVFKDYQFDVVEPAGAVTSIPIPDVIVRTPDTDVLGLALSYNRHSREWTTAMKVALVTAAIKFNPALSPHKIAQITGTSHPFARKVRIRLEESRDVESTSTSIDDRGRRHSRTKPRQAKSSTTITPVTTVPVAPAVPDPTSVSTSTYPPAPSKASIEVVLRRQIYEMTKIAGEALALEHMSATTFDDIRCKLKKIIKVGAGEEAEKPAPKPALKTTTFDETLYGKAMGYAPIVSRDPSPRPECFDRNMH